MRLFSKSFTLRIALNFWPNYLGNGIRVLQVSEDFRHARTRLRLWGLNRNYFGTHYGGNLFSMTDPFWAVMLFENLGSEYIVWDRRAEIDFIKAVRAPVFAEFILSPEIIEHIRAQADSSEKYLHWFEVEIKTAAGELAAKVRKQVYVKRKSKNPIER